MIKRYFEIIGRKSKKAFENKVKNELKNKVLKHYAFSIQKNEKSIFLQNKKDIDYAKKIGLKDNFISRLELNTKKLIMKIEILNQQKIYFSLLPFFL